MKGCVGIMKMGGEGLLYFSVQTSAYGSSTPPITMFGLNLSIVTG